MRNLNKRDPRSLAQAREQKAAKVAELREAISQPKTTPELAALWERTALALEQDISEIDQHLAGKAGK